MRIPVGEGVMLGSGVNGLLDGEDDGRGVPVDEVFAHARETGLVPPDAPADPATVLDLICTPGFSTRNGVKVVLGKQSFVRMRSATVGIAEGSSDSYDLPVYYATRLTWSGEYVHAAPWSVGSQGYANVSHGCTGMSTGNAEWFFNTVHEGDVVKVINSNGDTMEPFGNGFGDWNLAWKQWRTGSALVGNTPDAPSPEDAARLRPQSV